ncbi:MAG: hypothetical protein HZB77_13135 [Chloroflexi bacterium]|nr:hypothetical protein [Chloroflexota bacterium]
MNAKIIESRLRVFLLLLASALCLGTIAELWLTEHIKTPTQFLPFFLCGVGLAVVLTMLIRPRRETIFALRIVMGIIALFSLFGVYEHVEGNWKFALEIQSAAPSLEIFWSAIKGANPLLAPGILALTAMIAVAATYYHPALGNRND